MMSLEEVYKNCDQYWLWANIDGNGKKWNLCRTGKDEFEPDDMMIEFFGQEFSDNMEHYLECPCEAILMPKNLEE